ncbi:hypothetical protein [Nocardioides sp. B-3]|uniref:hypothetical protein n=1 Tax=Nocardioides sp. B-3 TaxID=2895565 RepID=UPI002152A0DA|nr:hypothetical protein [Nocardioides sp. B-3]UUZ61138.1 hypothetical protein LP418_11235 [Nocardioides sp. B-3]
MVRLIRIRTLAEAGVPLARVQEHRRRIARLAAGDSLALPLEVTAYLDRMRELGAPEVMVELERDSWILIAARWPEKIADYMVMKQAHLDDPLMRKMLQTLGNALIDEDPDAALAETADLLVEMIEQADARGELDDDDLELDSSFADLLDTVVLGAGADMVRLRDRLEELLAERGWRGLVKTERV